MKNIFLLSILIFCFSIIAIADIPSGIPQKAAAGLAKAKQWRSDAVLVMIEANDYSKNGNFSLKFSYYSPSDKTGLWILSNPGQSENVMQAGNVNWGTQSIAANFLDLPAAVAQARSSGMGAVVDHAMLRAGNQGLRWEITPDFNAPNFHVYYVAALPESEKDKKQDADSLFSKAEDEFLDGNTDAAIADFTKFIQLEPNNGRAYDNRGEGYLKKKMYDQALADYSKAVQLDPKDSEAYWRMGNVYAYKQMHQKAIDAYTNGINFDTRGNHMCFADRALQYNAMELYDRAIADYTKAIQLSQGAFYSSERAEYLNGRGTAYGRKGLYDQAIADFKSALQLNPNYELAKKNLEIVEGLKEQNASH